LNEIFNNKTFYCGTTFVPEVGISQETSLKIMITFKVEIADPRQCLRIGG
jgi:hypothetical protein